MSSPIISVENLGKRYRLGASRSGERYTALRDVIANSFSSSFRRMRNGRQRDNRTAGQREQSHVVGSQSSNGRRSEEFWALRDINFEVKQGEVVGIIGRNGAGKSTLLKILSRITDPTEGRVRIKGRVASLLEVGTGFHPELTGRENIYLNGAILGMARTEIKAKFDEIVAFAEVEQFLDTPVKRYSSGMYVRLAFAVAAHLEPEILIIDEVLAVGDADFQKKCLGKMGEVSRGGRTVLFVSHNMAAIEALCSSGILLVEGRLVTRDDAKATVQKYLHRLTDRSTSPLEARTDRKGSGALRFVAVELVGDDGVRVPVFQCGTTATILLRFCNMSGRDLRNVCISIGVDNESEQRVLLLDTTLTGGNFEAIPTGAATVRLSIPRLSLLPGRYHFTIFATANGIITDWIKNAASFAVEGGDYFGTGQLPPQGQGVFVTPHEFHLESGDGASRVPTASHN